MLLARARVSLATVISAATGPTASAETSARPPSPAAEAAMNDRTVRMKVGPLAGPVFPAARPRRPRAHPCSWARSVGDDERPRYPLDLLARAGSRRRNEIARHAADIADRSEAAGDDRRQLGRLAYAVAGGDQAFDAGGPPGLELDRGADRGNENRLAAADH